MYKETVGSTAIRKSSKIKEIQEEFAERIPRISDPVDYVSYTYFMVRLHDFDIA